MAVTERKVSDELEVSDRNFRSSYYKSLGFKDSEKSITHLETLLKADVFDVKKLRQFCLKHSLTVFYRPLVWKIILSVIPVFSDNETCSFVREQKKVEFQDLKRALVVMDRKEELGGEYSSGNEGGESSSGGGSSSGVGSSRVGSSSGGGSGSGGGRESEESTMDELTPGELDYHLIESSPSATPTPSPIFIPDKYAALMSNFKTSPRPSTDSSSVNITRSSPRSIAESSSASGTEANSRYAADSNSRYVVNSSSISVAESSSSLSTSVQDHRIVVQGPPCTPSDFVTIYLMQNKRLLSSTIDQMKQEEQVDMHAVAEGFMTLFDEEEEDDLYWLFASFMKKLESQSVLKENLLESFSRALEEIDCVLLEHIKDLDALSNAIPLRRWWSQCYAKDLPESCLGSVWDRVIGGSSMILVYIAVGIILSNKRRILSYSTAEQVEHLLASIPQENYGSIVGKAIKLWEDHGSPTSPTRFDEEQQSQEFLYEIEDYT